jgi:hypothetical protein
MTAPEKRRWTLRHHTILPIHCQLSMEKGSGSGWIREFSSIGASVISNLPLAVGDEVTLTLAKKGRLDLTFAATVRWKQGELLGVELKETSREFLQSLVPFHR